VRRELGDGIELDDDPARVDLVAVHRYLSEESYWAQGRSRAEQDRLVAEAERVVGLYDGARQVGFARIAPPEEEGFRFLADVYVLAAYRGRGLGVELVREALEEEPGGSRRWRLRTADAHGLYERLGFVRLDEKLMERQ